MSPFDALFFHVFITSFPQSMIDSENNWIIPTSQPRGEAAAAQASTLVPQLLRHSCSFQLSIFLLSLLCDSKLQICLKKLAKSVEAWE
jgi:hypothetical protein